MTTKKKILVVCPSYPAPESGAEQQDRADGLRQLVRLGYDVHVLAKIPEHASREAAETSARQIGVGLTLVPYCYSNRKLSMRDKIWKEIGKLRNPLYLDGAAYEFAEPRIRREYAQLLDTFKPDAVWFEYTYLWTLYKEAKKRNIAIVTRSLNFEPEHFLQEDGRSIFNYVKFIPKLLGEYITARRTNVMLAITPKEQKVYEKLLTSHALTLPLRSLPRILDEDPVGIKECRPGEMLHVFFLGSTYKVAHNRAAAAQVIEEIAPSVESKYPKTFVFHIFGGKLPDDLVKKCDGVHVIYEGYVPDLSASLQNMDIALTPSLMGCGQQQKVFEPLVRGFPAIVSPRAIAGYDFVPGKEYLPALNTGEFVDTLGLLRSYKCRYELAAAVREKSRALFSREKLDSVVQSALDTYIKRV